MLERQEEILALRQEFNAFDHNDVQAIKRWFATHSHLTLNEHAQVSGRRIECLTAMRRKAGIRNRDSTTIVQHEHTSHLICVPPDFGKNVDADKEWVASTLQGHTAVQICKAVGRSSAWMSQFCKKHGISSRRQPRNSCCTREWLEEHYVRRELGIVACGKLAGVSHQTIINWLNKFCIAVRAPGVRGQIHKHGSLWSTRLRSQLNELDIVRIAKLQTNHIHTRFRDYNWETYYIDGRDQRYTGRNCFVLDSRAATISHVPITTYKYESDVADGQQHPEHIILRRKHLRHATFMEQRLALHGFCRRFIKHDWPSRSQHPQYIIEREWEKLRNLARGKLSRYIRKDTFSSWPGHFKGYGLYEHFVDVSDYRNVFRSPKTVMNAINYVFNNHRYDITTTTVSAQFPYSIHKRVPLWYSPLMYCAIFKNMGITGRVLDLSPGIGSRALACAISGLEYTTLDNRMMRTAIDNGLADFTGLRYAPYSGESVDLVLYDARSPMADIPEALQYASKTKHMGVFVRRSKGRVCQHKYHPAQMLKVSTSVDVTNHEYLLWW